MLVKIALSEKMAQNLLSSANHRAFYKRWAEGGWAALITVLRIIRSIRREVFEAFCVGVKINSADSKDEEDMTQILRHIELIQREEIDYINLSGESFEDPQMMSTNSSLQPSSTRSRSGIREGFFLRTSEEIRPRFPDLALLVTGGFRSPNGVAGALTSNACDLIELGRPAVKYPELPCKIMFNEDNSDAEARFDVESAPSGGWLASKVRSVGEGAKTLQFSLESLEAALAFELWGCMGSKDMFPRTELACYKSLR
ncbi:NADH oxidase [Fusarium pseudocircinatum]|uniref:NADH oxidase n=1 Tax=Fusarium pseudocircinatum TaxID=56676 RepID=A0A8H5PS72_9HYPO|nr:NADH oxidase [Fusarium pseudocircinatum]